MNTYKRKQRLLKELRDKEYRDAFVAEHIDTGIPFQIRAIREQGGLSQAELGARAEMAQEAISRLEDPNYGKLTINTLKRLASAFDVGLIIRFVPFSDLVKWELNLSPDSLNAISFERDPYFQERGEVETVTADRNQSTVPPIIEVSSNVVKADFSPRRSSPSQRIQLSIASKA